MASVPSRASPRIDESLPQPLTRPSPLGLPRPCCRAARAWRPGLGGPGLGNPGRFRPAAPAGQTAVLPPLVALSPTVSLAPHSSPAGRPDRRPGRRRSPPALLPQHFSFLLPFLFPKVWPIPSFPDKPESRREAEPPKASVAAKASKRTVSAVAAVCISVRANARAALQRGHAQGTLGLFSARWNFSEI